MLQGGGGTQAVGAGGPAGGPCGVLYGKHSMFLVRKGSRDICSLTADRAGLYVIDRLSITSGNTTP